MKTLSISLALPLLLSLGCGSDKKLSPVTLALTGYQPHAGQSVTVKVKSANGQTTFGQASGTVPASGTLNLTVPNAIEPSGSYRVDWFVDSDSSGGYTPGTGGNFSDHQWRREINGNASGQTVPHAHDTSFTDISPF